MYMINIFFFLFQAPEKYLVRLHSQTSMDGLIRTRLQLQFPVRREHFINGEMTLRCTARISSLYFKTAQHSVDGKNNRNIHTMESRDLTAYAGQLIIQMFHFIV